MEKKLCRKSGINSEKMFKVTEDISVGVLKNSLDQDLLPALRNMYGIGQGLAKNKPNYCPRID